MSRKKILWTALATLALWPATAHAQADRPNVVIILADDKY